MNSMTHHRSENLMNENLLDVRHYWNVLMNHKWPILLLVVVCSAAAYLVSVRMTPQYRATTTVLVENGEAKMVSIEGVYGNNTLAKEYFMTQFEILKSRELAERLVDRLELTQHPAFDPRQDEPSGWKESLAGTFAVLKPWLAPEEPLTEAAIRGIVVSRVIKALHIDPINNTQLVKVSFDSPDPVLAARVANEMAEIYIDSHMEARMEMSKKASSWLTERLEVLSAQLKQSEEQLQDYREKETLVESAGANTLTEKELNELTSRHIAAANERARAENLRNEIRALGSKATVEQLLEIPGILNNELVRSLKTTQTQADIRVAELSKRYGPRHPQMIAARAEADEARAELTRHVIRVMRGLEADYQRALDTEQAIAAQLSAAKVSAQTINRKEFRLRELEREVETNRQLYDLFLARAKEASEAGIMPIAHARIVDPARPSWQPVSPNVGLNVALAFLGSLLAAITLAFLRDAFDNTLKEPDELEDKLHTRMLGFLPRIKARGNLPVEGFLSANFGHFAEAVRTLRTGIILSGMEDPYKTIMVTSSQPGEGKSTVALNLAESLGQMERVLLMEADLRQPTLARALDIPLGTPGLTNLIAGTDDLKECIQPLTRLGIDVLPAGILPGNPQELLSSKRLTLILEVLKRHYDRIIIDTPPTLAVSDAVVLSHFVDGVIYVIRAGATSAEMAMRGLRRLTDSGAPMIGSVLNHVDLKQSQYGEYYASDYLAQGKPLAIIPQSQRDRTEDLVMP